MSESNSKWRNLYKTGGWVAINFLIYSLTTMAVMLGLFAPPSNARDTLNILGQNMWVGLLRLDALTTVVMPFFYFLFLSLFIALRKKHPVVSIMTLLLGCACLTLFLAAPSFVSWLVFNDKFATATTEPQKTLLLAADETILATDLWHSSSAFVGGLLLHTSTLLISLMMLRSKNFSKLSAWTGAATHSLDLVRVLFNYILPSLSVDLNGHRWRTLPYLVSPSYA
jgi:hypothetical protein